MKNFKILLIPALLLLIQPGTAFSQNDQVKQIEREDLEELGTANVMRTMKATETQGTPYLNPKFLKGEAIINGGATTQTLYLRLNTETNTVEVARNDQVQALDTKKIEGFRIFTQEEDVLFRNGFNADVKDINRDTFLRIINNGNTKLVAHHKATLKENLASYGSATQQNKYVSFLNYYIVTPDGKFHKVKLNEKDILDVLSDKKSELQSIASSKELSFEDEDDVQTLLKEYNSMNS